MIGMTTKTDDWFLRIVAPYHVDGWHLTYIGLFLGAPAGSAVALLVAWPMAAVTRGAEWIAIPAVVAGGFAYGAVLGAVDRRRPIAAAAIVPGVWAAIALGLTEARSTFAGVMLWSVLAPLAIFVFAAIGAKAGRRLVGRLGARSRSKTSPLVPETLHPDVYGIWRPPGPKND